MTHYLPCVKLANVAPGQAEVRWFTPRRPRRAVRLVAQPGLGDPELRRWPLAR